MLSRTLLPLLLASPALAQSTFQGLGTVNARATGISSDGSAVCGTANSGDFRWDATNGFTIVAAFPDQNGFVLTSTGGLYGCATFANPSTNNQEAARWDTLGNLQFIGGLSSQSGSSLSSAYAMDDSGNVIVGLGWVSAGTAHAFKWTLGSGMLDLGSLGGSSRANGVSGDGSTVVGWSGNPRLPVYWSSGGPVPIGNGTTSGEGWAASQNGSVITGLYNNALFRWTSAGMVSLGKLPGSASSDTATGYDISADGNTIVGANGNPFFGTPWRALLWRSDLGLVELKSYLVTHGAPQAASWTLQFANAISADGTVIAGYGLNPSNQVESWIATIAPPSPLAPFCDPGIAGVTACPCSNPATGANRGCDNSSATGGASIAGAGIAALAADSVVISTANQRPSGTSILMQGTTQNTGIVFGQGVRCVGGTLKRLYAKNAAGGSISAPQTGDPSISARSAALGDPISGGSARYYFVYYRDPIVLGGCAATSTFNTTNSGTVNWLP